MTNPLRMRPLLLQQKLTMLLAGTASAALVVFAGAVFILEARQYRVVLVRDVATQAELMGVTVAPALAFNDPTAAAESLSALRTRAMVVAAWLVPENETQAFASFIRDGTPVAAPEALTYTGHHFEDPWLYYYEPVHVDGRRLGTLVLQADTSESRTALVTYTEIVALLLIGVLGLSILFASRLQRMVSRPILDLAATTRRVSELDDPSIRATEACGR
ncbi:MAG: hypothetical protein HC814_05325 [Rhodobacteraceae bacterium]|nr:hypothetical protein [Paracoccaceae bacterium]